MGCGGSSPPPAPTVDNATSLAASDEVAKENTENEPPKLVVTVNPANTPPTPEKAYVMPQPGQISLEPQGLISPIVSRGKSAKEKYAEKVKKDAEKKMKIKIQKATPSKSENGNNTSNANEEDEGSKKFVVRRVSESRSPRPVETQPANMLVTRDEFRNMHNSSPPKTVGKPLAAPGLIIEEGNEEEWDEEEENAPEALTTITEDVQEARTSPETVESSNQKLARIKKNVADVGLVAVPGKKKKKERFELTPVLLPLSNIVAVACGASHTLLLNGNGVVFSFGMGEHGKLGHGDEGSCITPTPIAFFKELSDGAGHIVSVSCGANHSAAIAQDGKALYTWGQGNWGCLGLGDNKTRNLPSQVELPGACTGVSCGSMHTMVHLEDSRIIAFGWAKNGRLGIGEGQPGIVNSPVVIPDFAADKVYAGTDYSIAQTASGQLYCCGVVAKFGRTGDAWSMSRMEILLNTTGLMQKQRKISVVACGGMHVLAVDQDSGVVVSWGTNKSHQLGRVATKPEETEIADEVPTLKEQRVLFVGAGVESSCAITEDALYVWGLASKGQLGIGECKDFVEEPLKVRTDPMQGRVNSVAIGREHSMLLTDAGKVFACGLKDLIGIEE